MLAGVGVDVCSVPRVSRVLVRWGDRFLIKVMHPNELATALSEGAGLQRDVFVASRCVDSAGGAHCGMVLVYALLTLTTLIPRSRQCSSACHVQVGRQGSGSEGAQCREGVVPRVGSGVCGGPCARIAIARSCEGCCGSCRCRGVLRLSREHTACDVCLSVAAVPPVSFA